MINEQFCWLLAQVSFNGKSLGYLSQYRCIFGWDRTCLLHADDLWFMNLQLWNLIPHPAVHLSAWWAKAETPTIPTPSDPSYSASPSQGRAPPAAWSHSSQATPDLQLPHLRESPPPLQSASQTSLGFSQPLATIIIYEVFLGNVILLCTPTVMINLKRKHRYVTIPPKTLWGTKLSSQPCSLLARIYILLLALTNHRHFFQTLGSSTPVCLQHRAILAETRFPANPPGDPASYSGDPLKNTPLSNLSLGILMKQSSKHLGSNTSRSNNNISNSYLRAESIASFFFSPPVHRKVL